MASTITANPNPVAFSLGATRNTTITWDAGGNNKGWVEEYVNGAFQGYFDGDPQNAKGQGSKVASIELGQTLEFRLIQNNAAKTLLASVKVTTKKELLTRPDAAIEALKRTDLQHIYDLKVSPGIDAVTITFRTRQPTNPLVYITEPGGILAGLRGTTEEEKQDHSAVFEGGSDGLAQDTVFNYRIVANATPGSFGPSKVEATGTFRTGWRTATVFFDSIHVRHDDSGDLDFQFGVGNADTHSLLGHDVFEPEDDVDDGEDVAVNKDFTIPGAPRVLWAKVTCEEDNNTVWTFFTSPGFDAFGSFPSFSSPGSTGADNDTFSYADVTEHFDISQTREFSVETPFKMPTAEWAIAFDVSGRLRVIPRPGEWLTSAPNVTHSLRQPGGFKKRATRSIWSARPGQSAVVTATHGHPHRVLLDPDGTVYHQALGEDPRAWRDARWTSLGGQFEGPLTVVAAGPDRVSLFGLSPDGAVLYKTHAPNDRPGEDWHTLGGDFVGPVAAATGEDGAIELFAMSEDGSVFHRALANPQRSQSRGEWEHIGDGVGGSMAALFSSRSSLSLFALGRDGEVVHKRRVSRKE